MWRRYCGWVGVVDAGFRPGAVIRELAIRSPDQREEQAIEVPKHWVVHSTAEKQNFAVAAEASRRGQVRQDAGDRAGTSYA